MSDPLAEPVSIAVRAYTQTIHKRRQFASSQDRNLIGPSDWVLVFDTETTTDCAQCLRVGFYQLRKAGLLKDAGLFYDPATVSESELALLRQYAGDHSIRLLAVEEFVDSVFYKYVVDRNALCVGFNLPFDISRLAINHVEARARGSKIMHGGFSFQVSTDSRRARIQVKHLNRRASIIQFTAPAKQLTPRSALKRGERVGIHRGYFVDVKTLASALLAGSWSLKTLANQLDTDHKKLGTDEHGGDLTREYLQYTATDVQVTWECFEKLSRQYVSYGLTATPISRIYSEASLGKAYFEQMGVRPFLEKQGNFAPALIGPILSSYFGGRAEVHSRRVITEVLYCDFTSMYPTVCVLMNLWSFVIAERTIWTDATDEIREFLDNVTLEDLGQPDTWPKLATIVRIQPNDDLFPVRSKYDGRQYSIGLNYIQSDTALWYTLADCVASKLLCGRTPKIAQAIRFTPEGMQEGLYPINIAGDPEYRVDPTQEDFYKRLIEQRADVKARAKSAVSEEERKRLNTTQNAIKILTNATSYGVFAELNVSEETRPKEVLCYGHSYKSFKSRVKNIEESGKYFHPLLGTLITGAARLMLAITERLAEDAGLSWAFCDTDSMALVKPDGIEQKEFSKRAKTVTSWFKPLNPYAVELDLLKIEDANFALAEGQITDEIYPLYCFAVSAKRYVLFNLNENGEPIIRKASAHGLGHLLPPYGEHDAPASIPAPAIPLDKIGVERWQYDLWYRIIIAARDGHPDQITTYDLPGYDKPAASRYAATTPELLTWFARFNAGKSYRRQVKPFGFLMSFLARRSLLSDVVTAEESEGGLSTKPTKVIDLPRPVAPYDRDTASAAGMCFDRETGGPVPVDRLKSYGEALAQYHLHPESKFENGEWLDSGLTRRRHLTVDRVENIGKEANRWEDRWLRKGDEDGRVVHGQSQEVQTERLESLRNECRSFGVRKLARAAGVSVGAVSEFVNGKSAVTNEVAASLQEGLRTLTREKSRERRHAIIILEATNARCQEIGLREFARRAGMDHANLSRLLDGSRRLSTKAIARLETALQETALDAPPPDGPKWCQKCSPPCT